jgi:hypothetical protein
LSVSLRFFVRRFLGIIGLMEVIPAVSMAFVCWPHSGSERKEN